MTQTVPLRYTTTLLTPSKNFVPAFVIALVLATLYGGGARAASAASSMAASTGSGSQSSASGASLSSGSASGSLASAASGAAVTTTDRWIYQTFVRLKGRSGALLALQTLPAPWLVPREQFETVARLWGSHSGSVLQTSWSPVNGCFSRDGYWETTGNCATEQTSYLRTLASLDADAQAAYRAALPAALFTALPSLFPPATTGTTAQTEAAMRALYMESSDEGAQRQKAVLAIRSAIAAARSGLETLPASTVQSQTAVAAIQRWMDATEQLLALLPDIALRDVRLLASGLATRLRNLDTLLASERGRFTAPAEIHRRIGLLLHLFDLDIPRMLTAAGLSLPASSGPDLLQLRSLVDIAKTQPCWAGTEPCATTPDMLLLLTRLTDALAATVASTPSVRASLQQRYATLLDE